MKNILLLTGLLTFTVYAMEIESDSDSSSEEIIILNQAPVISEKIQEKEIYTLKKPLPFLPILTQVKSDAEYLAWLEISMRVFFDETCKKPTAKNVESRAYEISKLIAQPVAGPKLLPQTNTTQEKVACRWCGHYFDTDRGVSSHRRWCAAKK